MPRRTQPVIVHVVNTLQGGGTERMLLALLRRFDPSRGRHVVVTLRGPGALAKELPDHVACVPLGCVGRSPRAWVRLAGVVRRYGGDVLHARNTGCWMDSVLASSVRPRCQVVLGFHGLDFAGRFSPRQRLVGGLARCLGARFACVAYSGARALQKQLGLAKHRIDVLVNGVDRSCSRLATDATRMALKRTLRFAADEFVLGMVGALVPVKRHDLVLGALKRLVRSGRRVRLVLVGDGRLRDDLTRRVLEAGLGDRVSFAGWRNDAAQWLAGFDAYICASASEGMSNALLEAMAARLPIVATDVGDNRYLLQDGQAGAIIPPDNEEAMVAALARMMDDPPSSVRMALRACERCAGFDIRRTAAAYENFYARLLNRPIVSALQRTREGDGAGRVRGSELRGSAEHPLRREAADHAERLAIARRAAGNLSDLDTIDKTG